MKLRKQKESIASKLPTTKTRSDQLLKTHPCNKCKRKFPSPSKLVIHKRKHTFPQSNPTKVLAKFKCTDKIHMKIHSNEFREPPICIFLHDSLEIFSSSCKVVLTRFKKKI